MLWDGQTDGQAGRQANMKKLTVAFRLRAYGWEGLQERDELAREEECVNCREGIIIEDIK